MTYLFRLLSLSILLFNLFNPLAFAANAPQNAVLKDINGQAIDWNSLKGKWVFINYWASWCQPCVEEISALNRFYENNKQKVVILAYNYDKLPVKQQLSLIKQHKISYPSLLNDPARQLHLSPIVALPTTFVFSPEGKFSETLFGPQTLSSLNQATRK